MYFYVRYWIYETSLLKEKPEKFLSLNFMNEGKFNELFDKREKIRLFLEEQYNCHKEKVSFK
jgi:hypothetical protein